MTFRQPEWLWLWVAIPVFIALHLVKPRYVRRTVSSNYLWRMSEAYRRKSFFGHRSKSLMMLLLQILSVFVLGLAAAGCSVRLPNSGKEWVFVIDASASMNRTAEQNTIFELAKERMLQKASQAPIGASVTLITADGYGQVRAEREQDRARIAQAVKDLSPGWQEDALDSALSLAQTYLSKNPDTEVFLYTDHSVAVTENITVVSLAEQSQPNLRVGQLDYERKDGGCIFRHAVLNEGEEREITLGLYLDGQLASAQTVSCGAETEVNWYLDAQDWITACVRLAVRDALEADNTVWAVNRASQAVRVLLSGNSYYLRGILEAFSDGYSLTSEDTEASQLTGYDLYVFSGKTPETMPKDGAVWLMNPSSIPRGIPLTLGETLYGTYLTAPEDAPDGHVSRLLNGLRPERIALRAFREAFHGEEAEPVLLCGAYPAALTGEMTDGFRYFVTLFDLEQTNLPLLVDFVYLTANALKDTAPPVLSVPTAAVGNPLPLNLPPDAESVALWSENGQDTELLRSNINSVTVTAPGLYQLTVTRRNGETRVFWFSASVPESESAEAEAIAALTLTRSGLAQSQPSAYNLTRLLAAALLALLLLEYGVYLYERI